ncbi:hypothetical protein PAEPH01_0155 [Pancytospora epiphaga]|nr:hypothetical protein PAEPH01_0155 [Pancytospora epiphaga]
MNNSLLVLTFTLLQGLLFGIVSADSCNKRCIIREESSDCNDNSSDFECGTRKRQHGQKVSKVCCQKFIKKERTDCSEIMKQVEGAHRDFYRLLVKCAKSETTLLNNELLLALNAECERVYQYAQSEIAKAERASEKKIAEKTGIINGELASINTDAVAASEKAVALIAKAELNNLLTIFSNIALQPEADIATYVQSPTGLTADVTRAIDKIIFDSGVAFVRIGKETTDQENKMVTTEMASLCDYISQIFRRLEKKIRHLSGASKAETARIVGTLLDKMVNAILCASESLVHRISITVTFVIKRFTESIYGPSSSDSYIPMMMLNSASVSSPRT